MGDSETKLNSLRKTMRKLSGQLPKGDALSQRQIDQYETDIDGLQAQVKALEEEMFHLRRRLEQTPKEFEFLRTKLSQSREQLEHAHQQNERLVAALQQAKEQLAALRAEVDKLAAPPNSYGTVLTTHPEGTVDVWTAGRKLKVTVAPGVEAAQLSRGQEVVLNEALNVVAAGTADPQGEVVRLKDRLDAARVVVALRADEERVVELSAALQDTGLQVGDLLRLDARAGVVLERLPKAEVEELVLEEVPNITYADVGGLGPQIEQIRDAIELPVLYAEHFAAHKLTPPKGVLLYGPPGCGKTLIAKAVANALAQQLSETDRDAEPRLLPEREGPRAPEQVRGGDGAEAPGDLRPGQGEGQRRGPRGHLLRRDGLPLPHPGQRHLLGRGVDHRPPVLGRAGRGGGAHATSSSSGRATGRT